MVAQDEMAMPRYSPWEIGRPWKPDWVTMASFLPTDVLAPRPEDVEIGVGPQHPHGPRRQLLEAPLRLVTLLGPHLGEAGGEDHRGPHAKFEAVLQDRQRLAHQHDGQVDGEGDVPDRRVGRRAEDLALRGVHRHDRGAARRSAVRAPGAIAPVAASPRCRWRPPRRPCAGARAPPSRPNAGRGGAR